MRFQKPRPKILVDIKSKNRFLSESGSVTEKRQVDPFTRLSKRVNLKKKNIVVPAKDIARGLIILTAAMFLLFGFASAPTSVQTFAANSQLLDADRKALENQLAEYEKQISQYEDTISNYKKQGKSLKSEIDKLNAKIAKINLQIKATLLSIKELDQEISDTNNKISVTEDKIGSDKEVLSKIIQNIYENEGVGMMEMMLRNTQLSDFFGDLNNLTLVQDNLRTVLEDVVALRNDLVDQKKSLALERSDAAAIKTFQEQQMASVNETKSQKDTLLKVTKNQEAKYKEILDDTKKKAAEIRSRIFRMLGGGELPFGDAVKIAQVAEKATGVRAAFILSILTQESSVNNVIGRNLGQCYYNTPRNNKSGTVMADSQKSAFLSLMNRLNLNPESTPVSCPITSDGAYGGAMGPAQFMPTTWSLYEAQIGRITGGNPPSPFNNLDAFTATSLYLKDGLVGCQQNYSAIFSQENCAAAKYYAGQNYRRYMSVGRYGYRVADRAQQFQQDIDLLSSQN